MKAVVGLGNLGAQYERTRHNLGFRVVRCLAEKLDVKFVPSRVCRGLEASATISDVEIKLLLPATFMNLSGKAVKPFIDAYKVTTDQVLIVCDDFSLHFGQIRLRRKGSDGGHNGICSVIENLGTEQFPRLRLGVGEPHGKQAAADFVLSEFDNNEKKELDCFIQEAADCCRAWVTGEMEQVMSQFNKRKGDG